MILNCNNRVDGTGKKHQDIERKHSCKRQWRLGESERFFVLKVMIRYGNSHLNSCVFAALPISSLYPFLYYLWIFWAKLRVMLYNLGVDVYHIAYNTFFCYHMLSIVYMSSIFHFFHRLRILVLQRRRKILAFMLDCGWEEIASRHLLFCSWIAIYLYPLL